MAELKTRATDASVEEFIAGQEDARVRADCEALLAIMGEATGAAPVMWGASIVGFGRYPYQYASGAKGEWFQVGFSPRKKNITLYIMAGFTRYEELMAKLGKHKIGKSCLYINKLDDVDRAVLVELVGASVGYIRESWPAAQP